MLSNIKSIEHHYFLEVSTKMDVGLVKIEIFFYSIISYLLT